MILNEQQTANILNEQGIYDSRLFVTKLGVKMLGENVCPLGNIVCFEAPSVVGSLSFKNSLIFLAQTDFTDSFGAICLQRLYLAQLGSILSVKYNQFCFVQNGCLFTEDKQNSIFMFTQIKNTMSLQTIIALDVDTDSPFVALELDEEQLKDFKKTAIECFQSVCKEIYTETQRDCI